MKSSEFLNMLKTAHDVPNYYSNKFPKNLGYYDGSRYSFDCWNLIKVVLSGWKPTGVKKSYIEPSQLVTGDVDGKTLLNRCTSRSKDFSKISVPGTYLYLASNPHSGIYIGDTVINGKTYNVIECMKNSWGNGVSYTYVDKDGSRRKYKGASGRSLVWSEYGLLTPYVEYDVQAPVQPSKVDVSKYPVLRMVYNTKTKTYTTRGSYVLKLQQILVSKGYDPKGCDSIFGPGCDKAVRQFQKDSKLVVDGCVGPKTWDKLING